MERKFSIIIAAYNGEKYISKVMKSIINQTYKNYEILFVNDGSEDNTLDEINKFKENNIDLKILSLKHGGVSRARNIAIDQVTGDWITFIDVDDYVDNEYLEFANTIIENNSKIEIIQSNMILENGNKCKEYSKINTSIVSNKKDIINSIISQNISKYTYFGNTRCIGGKFYKRNLIKDIKFPIDLLCFEDGLFNMYAFYKAKEIFVDESALYHYVINNDSATHKINPKQTEQNELILEKIEEFCQKKSFENTACSICCFEQFKVDIKNSFILSINYHSFIKEIDRSNIKYQEYWKNLKKNYFKILNIKDKIIFIFLYKKMYLLLYLLYKIKRK